MVAFRLEPGKRVLVKESGCAAGLYHIDCILLLQFVYELMQPIRKSLFKAEHFQLFGCGKTVIGHKMIIAAYLVAEKAECLVERLVVPVLRFDKDAVHIKYYCFDFHIYLLILHRTCA